jgi:DNA-binding MarR family transcriptional regulator
VPRPLTEEQWQALLSFRVALRSFIRWGEGQAASVGLTPAQHQLLVAIRGHDGDVGPTISDLAGYLFVRHHSAIGLVDRAEALGLVERRRDPSDQRLVRVVLTARGRQRVDGLAVAHLEELRRLAPVLDALVGAGSDPGAKPGIGGARDGAPTGSGAR